MQIIILYKASYNRYYNIIRLFLRNGYKFESYINDLSLIPLLIAYQKKEYRIIDLLLRNSANFNILYDNIILKQFKGAKILPSYYFFKEWIGYKLGAICLAVISNRYGDSDSFVSLIYIIDLLTKHGLNINNKFEMPPILFAMRLLEFKDIFYTFDFYRLDAIEII